MSEFALSYVEWLRAFFLQTKNSICPYSARKGISGSHADRNPLPRYWVLGGHMRN